MTTDASNGGCEQDGSSQTTATRPCWRTTLITVSNVFGLIKTVKCLLKRVFACVEIDSTVNGTILHISDKSW